MSFDELYERGYREEAPFFGKEWKPQEGFLPALSIRQPYAWLVAQGYQNLVSRNWTTSYRGPLFIHTGKEVDPVSFRGNELFLPYWERRFGPAIAAALPKHKRDYPTGGIIGCAMLTDVITDFTESTRIWFDRKYCFVLKEVNALPFRPHLGNILFFAVRATTSTHILDLTAVKYSNAFNSDYVVQHGRDDKWHLTSIWGREIGTFERDSLLRYFIDHNVDLTQGWIGLPGGTNNDAT